MTVNPTTLPIARLRAAGFSIGHGYGHDAQRNHHILVLTPPGVYREQVVAVMTPTNDGRRIVVTGPADRVADDLNHLLEVIARA